MTKNFANVKNDVWETPDNIFHHATDIFGVYPRLDVCATEQNRKCEFYFDEVANGLNQNWFFDTWMNPPYSNASKWIYKAYEESIKGRIKFIKDGILSTQASQHPSCFVCWRRHL